MRHALLLIAAALAVVAASAQGPTRPDREQGAFACPDFTSAADARQLRLVAAGGPRLDRRTLTPRVALGGLLAPYARDRDAAEELLTGYAGGLRAELDLWRGLYAGLGVAYDLYLAEALVPGPVQVTSEPVPVFTDDGQVLIRTDSLQTRFRENLRAANRVHVLTPAASVGYRHAGGRLAFSAAAELGYGFLVAARGATLSPASLATDAPPPQALDAPGWLAEQPGLRYGGRLGLDLALTPRLGLVAEATALAGVSLAGPADPLVDAVTRLSADLGLRYTLAR